MATRAEVRFHPAARQQITNLFQYIMDQDGLRPAEAFVARIDEVCRGLGDFPKLGRPVDGLGDGHRLISVDRRTAIVYRLLAADVVEILGVYYGGQDFGSA